MSMERLKSAFESIQHSDEWSLQLLRITTSKRNGTKYASRQITIDPDGALGAFVRKLAEHYLGTDKGSLSTYSNVDEYDGTTDGLTIYKMESSNALIQSEYNDFIETIASPDVEADSMTFKSAYVIKGSTIVLGEDTPVKMIAMQNPITTLRHKYSLVSDKGRFKELSEKVLSLRPTLDIIILGDTVYFLTMNGENLFNMERAYKAVCSTTVESIVSSDMVSGSDVFKSVAEQGHNPRRFVSFNNERFEALKNPRTRKSMAKQFNIPLDEAGKLDATTAEAAERIVKVLCNKGMVDPFKKAPVEVSGARPW